MSAATTPETPPPFTEASFNLEKRVGELEHQLANQASAQRYQPEQFAQDPDDPDEDWMAHIQKCIHDLGTCSLSPGKEYLLRPEANRQYITVRPGCSLLAPGGATLKLASDNEWIRGQDVVRIFGTGTSFPQCDNVRVSGVTFDMNGAAYQDSRVTLRAVSVAGRGVSIAQCIGKGMRAGAGAECFVFVAHDPDGYPTCTISDSLCYAPAGNADQFPAGQHIWEISCFCAGKMFNNYAAIDRNDEMVSPTHTVVPWHTKFGFIATGNVAQGLGMTKVIWLQRGDLNNNWWHDPVAYGNHLKPIAVPKELRP